MEKKKTWLHKIHTALFSASIRQKFEKVTIYAAVGGFLTHLGLIFLYKLGFLPLPDSAGELLTEPISAIYTPFSFILIFEVYELIYYLPRSFTTSIGKQYEIISLIVIRRIFKDISNLELKDFWSNYYDRMFVGDMLGFLLLFGLIYFFHRLKKKKPIYTDPPLLNKFIAFKKATSIFLVPVFVGMALYSFVEWAYELQQFRLGMTQDLSDINKVFYDEFFTTLIMVDVLILLISLHYTDRYSQLIRNAGFIISTVLIRLSFSVTGLLNIILIVAGVLFGVLILAIYNQYGKLDEGSPYPT
ncbi:MAG: hypothetical protein HRU40_08750 [Saprospiraceae bacterium]|nr:hypothetical protein [Saprospiraceae bacterium]